MPHHYHVMLMPEALDGMIQICAHIERDSPQNAALVAGKLVTAIDSLEFLPHRYKVHQQRKDPGKTVRSMPVPPFIVYYRIDEARRAVRVLAVLHGARKQPKPFK